MSLTEVVESEDEERKITSSEDMDVTGQLKSINIETVRRPQLTDLLSLTISECLSVFLNAEAKYSARRKTIDTFRP